MSGLSLLPSAGDPVTMTSLELVQFINNQRDVGEAELTHANFLAKVPKVLGERSNSFECDVPDTYGRPRKAYRFPKREACLMAMSYSYDLQAKVYDRMTQLESVAADPRIPKTYVDALRLAADQADEIARKDALLAIAAPKADALDLISASEDALTITQTAKTLGVKLDVLTKHLHAEGWVYRQNDSWVAYQQHIQNGRLQYKEAHYTDQKTGQACIRPYCHVLPKGLTLLAKQFSERKAA